MKLHKKHSQVRTNLLMMNPLPSIATAYRLLVQDEKQQRMSEDQEVKPMVFAVADDRRNNNYNNNKVYQPKIIQGPGNNKFAVSNKRTGNSFFCNHCNMAGHSMERCWKLHGYPPGHRGKRFAGVMQGTEDVPSDESVTHISEEQYQQFLSLINEQEQPVHAANVA
ncbi:hypothetical protein SOVF_148360, partial [Spinacia oleracea]